MTNIAIRRIEACDIAPLLDIYNHYVATTHISFDVEPRTLRAAARLVREFCGNRTPSMLRCGSRRHRNRLGLIGHDSRTARPTTPRSKPASILRRVKAGRGWAGGSINRCSMRSRTKTSIAASVGSRCRMKPPSASIAPWASTMSAPTPKSAANSAASGMWPGMKGAWANRPVDVLSVQVSQVKIIVQIRFKEKI